MAEKVFIVKDSWFTEDLRPAIRDSGVELTPSELELLKINLKCDIEEAKTSQEMNFPYLETMRNILKKLEAGCSTKL